MTTAIMLTTVREIPGAAAVGMCAPPKLLPTDPPIRALPATEAAAIPVQTQADA